MTPVLYILARNDIASMNPGKLAAQVAHAATHFEQLLPKLLTNSKDQEYNNRLSALVAAWRGDRYFGTTIVLEETDTKSFEAFPRDAHWTVTSEDDIVVCGTVTDPTYPLRDGSVTHLISLETCHYIFFDKDASKVLTNFMEGYKLYP